jgi:hypothetical protein
MAKFCQECGAQIVDENSLFCSKCGAKVLLTSPIEQSPVTQSTQNLKTENTGDKLKKAGKWIAICCGGAIICVIIAAFIFGMTGNVASSKTPSLSVAEIKSQAQTIPYASLMRNPDTYKNTIVHFKGKVVQVQQIYGDTFYLRIATKQTPYIGYFDDIIYVDYKGNRLLEDDIVDLWGNFVGLKSYTAVLGNEITIPEINALHAEIVESKT